MRKTSTSCDMTLRWLRTNNVRRGTNFPFAKPHKLHPLPQRQNCRNSAYYIFTSYIKGRRRNGVGGFSCHLFPAIWNVSISSSPPWQLCIARHVLQFSLSFFSIHASFWDFCLISPYDLSSWRVEELIRILPLPLIR